MTPGVVIPFGGHARDRAENLRRVIQHYEPLALPETGDAWAVWVETDDAEPFPIAQAINDGVDAVADFDPFVLQWADCLVAHERLREAVALAGETEGLVKPYTRCARLSEGETRRLDLPADFDRYEGADDYGAAQVVVCSRATFEKAGGYDPRFVGWGAQDYAFELVCEALYGPTRRLTGVCLHLWHDPDPTADPTHPVLIANRELWARYLAALGNAERLLAIRREAGWLSSSSERAPTPR